LFEVRDPLLAVIDCDMAMWMSIASGEHGSVSFLWRIAVLRDDTCTILQQSWPPIFGTDWMTARVHSTGFKGPSAIGGTFAERTLLCVLIGIVRNRVFVDRMT